MKLKKIVVNNFRNYLGEVTFDLSRDVIILYGDNGNGKSSFFDAIEWCMTGEITRFILEKNEYKHVLSNYNMAIGDECSVALYFDEYVLKKSFKRNTWDSYSNINTILYKENSDVRVSGEDSVRQKLGEIVSKSTNGKWNNKVLSQAYILSQSQINNFITKDSPKDRYRALASIMGFEKINNLKNNLTRTIEIFEKSISNIDEQLTEVEVSLKNEQDKFNLGIEKIGIRKEEIGEINEQVDIILNSKNLSMIKTSLSEIMQEKKSLSVINLYDQNSEVGFEELIRKHSTKIKKLERLLSGKQIRKNEVHSEIKQLDKERTRIMKENELLDKKIYNKQKLTDYLGELQASSINYNVQLTQELKAQINELQLILTRVAYCCEKYDKYQSYKNQVKLARKEIDRFNIELEIYEKHISDIKMQEQQLLAELSKGAVSDSIQKLLLLIENAHNITESNSDFEDTCPVCDSHIDNFSSVLNVKINKLITQSGKHKELIESNIECRKKLEEEKSVLFSNQFAVNKKIKINKQLILENSSEINFIEDNILFDQNLFNSELLTTQIKQNSLEVRLKLLDKNLQTSQQIDKIREELSKFENNSFEFSSTTVEVIDSQIKEKNEEINRIQEIIIKVSDDIDKNRIELNDIESNYSILRKLFSKYNINNVRLLNEYLRKESAELRIREEKIENTISQATKINDLTRIKEHIDSYEIKVELYKDNKKYFLDKMQIMNNKVEDINFHFGDQASDFLNSSHSPIRKYYQYLNPNPAEFAELYFEIKDNNELEIKVKNESNNVVANYILSSGQLNVLAVSVFIATNTSQTFSFFDFIAIDDPIQNMDDVNRFSITDVLSQLKQQLIISTHDSDYLNLFIKKNESRLNNIAVFHLDTENNSYKNIVDYSNFVEG